MVLGLPFYLGNDMYVMMRFGMVLMARDESLWQMIDSFCVGHVITRNGPACDICLCKSRDNKVRFICGIVCTLALFPILRHRGTPRKHLLMVRVRQQRITKQLFSFSFSFLVSKFLFSCGGRFLAVTKKVVKYKTYSSTYTSPVM